jgi:hypothetical protein
MIIVNVQLTASGGTAFCKEVGVQKRPETGFETLPSRSRGLLATCRHLLGASVLGPQNPTIAITEQKTS